MTAPSSSGPATVAIIGGGPAGLRAAETAAMAGAAVTLYDAKPSTGRKLLVAGRGGLNLTHGEPLDGFISRYTGPPEFWRDAISGFTPGNLRDWAAGLGIETFEQRTGRVYPREMKAAPLLRRWIERLRGMGVRFEMNHRWTGLKPGPPVELAFRIHDEPRTSGADAVVLAIGGASWPITGSDGNWASIVSGLGIRVNPLIPANCGWEHAWPAHVLEHAEGKPLKNVVVRAGDTRISGEVMITAYGVEGGTVYQLGPELRAMQAPCLHLDLKPTFTIEQLASKLRGAGGPPTDACVRAWKLSPAAHAILRAAAGGETDAHALASLAKNLPVPLTRPRPIDEAISSAGGICWSDIDESLMLCKMPGVFVAGEMIDWEAPTGGYLMQGCFATGGIAGANAARHAQQSR